MLNLAVVLLPLPKWMHMFGLKQHNDEYFPQVKVLIESMLSGNFLSVDQMTVFTVQSVPDGL